MNEQLEPESYNPTHEAINGSRSSTVPNLRRRGRTWRLWRSGNSAASRAGPARAAKLTAEQRREIAQKGARARWANRAQADN